jgi:hypothetical protein
MGRSVSQTAADRETHRFSRPGSFRQIVRGVLHHVLGESGISEDPPGDAEELVTDLVHQICERVLIARADSLHGVSTHEALREQSSALFYRMMRGSDHGNRSARTCRRGRTNPGSVAVRDLPTLKG